MSGGKQPTIWKRETSMRIKAPLLILAGVALWLVSFASLSEAVSPQTRVIEVRNMAFGPAPEGLHIGDEVKWVNHDPVEHTATATDGSFDVALMPDSSGEVRLKQAGVISYYCRFHPGMKGQLTIAPAK